MAEQESTVSAFELSQRAVEQAYAAFDLVLELETLLLALGEPDAPPKWVFHLSRMAERASRAADVAHTAALKVRFELERSEAA
ncbi:hypothetical protein M5C99_11855 [Acidovorax sp. NCPPB 2350]|nr:hypothetical protein M5C99_11855 [Acidovorax sp. NCPPB 2350]